MKVKAVLGVRHYKAGYEIREEVIDDSDCGGDGFTMKRAYTPDGHYIGDSKQGYRLCKKRGIAPELAYPDNNVCCIGFCEKEQKWYGWSHRLMNGFGVGDLVVKGDCAYTPRNPDELIEELKEQYSGDYYHNVRFEVSQNEVTVRYDKGQVEDNGPQSPDGFVEALKEALPNAKIVEGYEAVMDMIHPDGYETYPLGRGEWTTKTLRDCRQMAIDFAGGVS